MPSPIDNCEHDFPTLANRVLPEYLAQLRESIRSPFPATWIREPRVGRSALLKRLDRKTDFSGCYVFVEGSTAIYVGISRGVIGRLFQHLTSTNHFAGSLAYFLAKTANNPGGTRALNMTDSSFRTSFEDAQRRLEQCSIATVEIKNPLELHIFEAYAAMELGTGEFNTFRTH